ncbi:EthD family reductase [Bradyrhizobium sp. RDT46]|uniref:EthD family reductase n=1 Tax=Bradyrhizobium sp. RDT46 TaxID=3341829 RepID=UPI0035C73A97
MTNATMIVTCSGGTFFDRDYYVDVHLPLALASWQKHGLESAAAFFPRDGDAVDVSVGVYRFRDEAALNAALASAETGAVMADVPRFTDAKVSRMIAAPL